MVNCKNCGEKLEGDGYTTVLHCPNVDAEDYTPDDNVVYCTEADLTLARHCIDFEEYLPEWAIGFAEGKLQLGAGLPTKDGRRTGNAHIIEITEPRGEPLYKCLTDAGNIMHLSFSEVQQLFYPPKYVSSVEDIKTKFLR